MSALSDAINDLKEGLTALERAITEISTGQPEVYKEVQATDGDGKTVTKKVFVDLPQVTLDEAKAALFEVVQAFDDGGDAATELLLECQDGVRVISDLNPVHYQELIDRSKAYLESCATE